MAKILSNGRRWGSGNKVAQERREQIIQFLKSSELPICLIASRLGVPTGAISSINAAENYIRPKGHRPVRF